MRTLAPLRSLEALPGPIRGMIFMLAATFFFAAMIACARVIADEMHPFEVTFFRTLFGLLVLAPVLLRQGLKPLRTRRLGVHAVRNAFGAASMLLFYWALVVTSLSKAVALDFTSPLFGCALAVLVLGERMGWRRVLALGIGLAGTLVIVRPGAGALDLGALALLGSAALAGCALTAAKSLARTETSLTMTLYFGLFCAPLALAAALPYWLAPSGEQLAWLLAMGVFGSISNLAGAQALREADLTAVAPFDFTRMIWAGLFGYLFFGERPDAGTWIGAVMIFAAVAFVTIQERRASRRGTPPSAPPAAA